MKSYFSLNVKPATIVTSAFAAAVKYGLAAEFILCCCRAKETADDDGRIVELLEQELDWNELLALARRHGVLPLLHQKLASLGWDRVPSRPRADLETFFRSNAARNLAMVAELTEILKFCHSNGIPIIPFKGVVLAQQLYGDFALRVSHDLDLLVRQQDATKLCELLARRGYASSLSLRSGYEGLLLRSIRQLPLANKNRPFEVEVHTALLYGPDARATTFEWLRNGHEIAPLFHPPLTLPSPSGRGDSGEVISCQFQSLRLESTEFVGYKIDVLTIDTVLLYLCAHGAKHCWERLGWICDVAQLVRRNPDLDWPLILARARQLHWERALFLGLTLARDLLGVTLPESVEQRQVVVQALATEAASKLFAARRPNEGEVTGLWFQLRCLDRWRDRAWLAWAVTLRPTVADWQSLTLPVRLAFLYYLFRPIRLVGKYAARLVGL